MGDQFTRLINQVITILTSFNFSTEKADEGASIESSEDTFKQGKEMQETVRKYFIQGPDSHRAINVLNNFMRDPEEYRENLQKRLLSALQDDPDFAHELRQIVSHPPFIGRNRELQAYMDFLRQNETWIWIFTALERSGKTALLKQMEKKTPTSISVIRLDFAREQSRYEQSSGKREKINAVTYLNEFADLIKKGCGLKNHEYFIEEFDKIYDESKHNIFTFIEQNFSAGEKATLAGNKAKANTAIDTFVQQQERNERTHMTTVFLRIMESFQPQHLVIQLDSCEWLMESVNTEVREWLVRELLLRLHQSMQQRQRQLQVVMMSSVDITLPALDSKDQRHYSLGPLDRESVQNYLERIGVDEPEFCKQFYNMTEGHAFCVCLLCQLWQQWEKAGKLLPSWKEEENALPGNETSLIRFQKEFYAQADIEFINKHVLGKFPMPSSKDFNPSPLYDLTKYGFILREFNLPSLKAVFSKLLPEEPRARMVFDQLTCHLYIVRQPDKEFTYAMHELFRTVLGLSIRAQEPGKWQYYHERARRFFKDKRRFVERLRSPDWHYHNLAYLLVKDANGEAAKSYWKENLEILEQMGVIPPTPLLDAACDKTLMFTSVALEAQKYKLGIF